jgi:hypothetical protein
MPTPLIILTHLLAERREKGRRLGFATLIQARPPGTSTRQTSVITRFRNAQYSSKFQPLWGGEVTMRWTLQLGSSRRSSPLLQKDPVDDVGGGRVPPAGDRLLRGRPS